MSLAGRGRSDHFLGEFAALMFLPIKADLALQSDSTTRNGVSLKTAINFSDQSIGYAFSLTASR